MNKGAALLGMAMLIYFSGCSGGSSAQIPEPTGTYRLNIQWPDKTGGINRIIPEDSQSIEVKIEGEGMPFSKTLTAGSDQTELIIEDLPEGTKTVTNKYNILSTSTNGDLVYNSDYSFYASGSNIPQVNADLDEDKIFAHPGGSGNRAVIRILLNGDYGTARLTGFVRMENTNGNTRFLIYSPTGTVLFVHVLSGLSRQAYDVSFDYNDGDYIRLEVSPNGANTSDWASWDDLRIRGE